MAKDPESYASDNARGVCAGLEDLRARWADTEQRAEIIEQLADRGADFQTVAAQAGKPHAEAFDLQRRGWVKGLRVSRRNCKDSPQTTGKADNYGLRSI